MWQKCPVCDGTGNVPSTLSSSSYKTCSVCKGKMIISEKTGTPPNYEQNEKERDMERRNLLIEEIGYTPVEWMTDGEKSLNEHLLRERNLRIKEYAENGWGMPNLDGLIL